MVSGEAGIGKTRLLEELTESAVELGHLTLVGRAAEYERELPFGLVIDAVDPYLESLESQAYERLARDGVEDLAGIFPALRGLGGKAEEPVSATERFRIHNSVRDLLERLAARQPILFVLEDVHWADGASLELITHLIRRPPQAAVTLALSFRTGQVDRAAVKAVADRPPESVTVVELGPLDAQQSAALLSRSNGANVAYVQRESGGNPFYLLQLADAGVTAAAARPGICEWPHERARRGQRSDRQRACRALPAGASHGRDRGGHRRPLRGRLWPKRSPSRTMPSSLRRLMSSPPASSSGPGIRQGASPSATRWSGRRSTRAPRQARRCRCIGRWLDC